MASLFDDIPVGPELEDDIHDDRPDYVYLSDVFKYISHYRRAGHQIGRKVGDMLEVVTLAALHLNDGAKSRLVLEPKLVGFSGAGHKVEFGLFNLGDDDKPLLEMRELAGFVECKKVGVEQTIDGGFKRSFGARAIIPYGTPIAVKLAPKWADAARINVVFSRNGEATRIRATLNGEVCHEEVVGDGERIIFGLTVDGRPFFLGNAESLRDIPESIRSCRILEIDSHTREGVRCLLNTCLAGPQTPEKAKQASFVALDVRKGLFGQFDMRENETACPSILVMTEFSHWEQKSVNMISACIDHNLVVDDALIIEAMEAFENAFGDGFLDLISKETFMARADVRAVTFALIGDGRIFRDIKDNIYKAISISAEGRVMVI